MFRLVPLQTGPLVLTGLPLVPSLQLRIKASAVHAGPSPQSPASSLPTTSPNTRAPKLSLNSPSNSLSPASSLASAAMVAGKVTPSTTTSRTVPTTSKTGHTLPLMVLALSRPTKLPTCKPLPTPRSLHRASLRFKLPSFSNQSPSQSLLAQPTSNPTRPVC